MSTLTDFSCFFQNKSLIVELVFSKFWIYVAKKTDKVSYYFFSILYSIKTVISYTEIKLSFIHHSFIIFHIDKTGFYLTNIGGLWYFW